MAGWRLNRVWMLLGAGLMLIAAPLSAHLTPNSEVVIDFREDGLLVDAIIPEADYAMASGTGPGQDKRRAVHWLAGQVAAKAPDGRPWTVTVQMVEFVQRTGPPDLHALIWLTPPQGAPVRRLALRWDAVVQQNPDHWALVLIGHDHGANVLPKDRRLIGAVRGERTTLMIDRGTASNRAAFVAALRMGVQHIAGGTDHLLFLLCLLLPAPLLAAGGRWRDSRTARSALAQLAKVITAFTLGHSLTLLIAAMSGGRLPQQPVELAIALSVLLTAVHAMRPLFPRRETWIAAGFGLIHGLAFATWVSDAGVGGSQQLLAILGFNLGIEAVQLLVAALAMVPLMLMAGTPDYRWIRPGLALTAAVVALGWLIERASGSSTLLTPWVAAAVAQAPWLLAAMTGLAIIVRLKHRTAG